MNGRNQPYLDTNGTGFYERTPWQDEVEGIQDGTPVDEQNLNNIEGGVNSANLTAEFLTEVMKHHGEQIVISEARLSKSLLPTRQERLFLIIPQRRLHCLSTETVLITQ